MTFMAGLQVRHASPGDFGRIEELVAGMFRDLGTWGIPTTWSADLHAALHDRLGSSVSAFVTVDTKTIRWQSPSASLTSDSRARGAPPGRSATSSG